MSELSYFVSCYTASERTRGTVIVRVLRGSLIPGEYNLVRFGSLLIEIGIVLPFDRSTPLSLRLNESDIWLRPLVYQRIGFGFRSR